jgi:hypothetical protein
MPTKIFCIGVHKTGTKTIAEALKRLGYRVVGPVGTKDPEIAHRALALAESFIDRYDAFQDNPWPILYREMDQLHPGSKFILTVRDPADWIRSQVAYFGTRESPMREWIYGVGSPVGNEGIYLQRFNRHNREVLSYFGNRPGDLLVMELANGDGWRQLCRFLDKPERDEDFPHMNKTRAA